MPQLLEQLSEEEKRDLAAFLPRPDVTESGEITEEFLTRGNNIFWESAEAWQTLLYSGAFSSDYKPKEEEKTDRPFKDDQYEEYWGEKLKKIEKATTKKRSRRGNRK